MKKKRKPRSCRLRQKQKAVVPEEVVVLVDKDDGRTIQWDLRWWQQGSGWRKEIRVRSSEAGVIIPLFDEL
jgi:hypothetical protein